MKNIVKELKKLLMYEFSHHKTGGVYSTLQTMMAYNSNRIEGSTLTEKQTRSIFETGSTYSEGDTLFRAKDVEEMTGHFRMFNNVIKTIDEPLSEDIIKKMHFDLKIGVFEDMANGYPCGEYKNRGNRVSDVTTAKPNEVKEKMTELISLYNKKSKITLTDLAEFHTKYETIHPFQDGNGRIGRMILFKECLKNDIMPVIILNDHKTDYYKSLDLARAEGYDKLAVFFEKEQKILYDKIYDMIISKDKIPNLVSKNETESSRNALIEKIKTLL